MLRYLLFELVDSLGVRNPITIFICWQRIWQNALDRPSLRAPCIHQSVGWAHEFDCFCCQLFASTWVPLWGERHLFFEIKQKKGDMHISFLLTGQRLFPLVTCVWCIHMSFVYTKDKTTSVAREQRVLLSYNDRRNQYTSGVSWEKKKTSCT